MSSGKKKSAPGEIRTPDPLIRSQQLYPLSYGRATQSFSCQPPTFYSPCRKAFAEVALARKGSSSGGLFRHPLPKRKAENFSNLLYAVEPQFCAHLLWQFIEVFQIAFGQNDFADFGARCG